MGSKVYLDPTYISVFDYGSNGDRIVGDNAEGDLGHKINSCETVNFETAELTVGHKNAVFCLQKKCRYFDEKSVERGRFYLRACKPIQKGEEILIEYGPEYWKRKIAYSRTVHSREIAELHIKLAYFDGLTGVERNHIKMLLVNGVSELSNYVDGAPSAIKFTASDCLLIDRASGCSQAECFGDRAKRLKREFLETCSEEIFVQAQQYVLAGCHRLHLVIPSVPTYKFYEQDFENVSKKMKK